MEEALRAALKEAARVGLTSIHDITVGPEAWNGNFTGEIELLRRAELEGWLTCRIYAITPIANWKNLEQAGISHDMGSDFLEMGAVKAFADGSLGSRTAWMFEPYDDDPSNSGLPMPIMAPPAKLEEIARQADKREFRFALMPLVIVPYRAFSTFMSGLAASIRPRTGFASNTRSTSGRRTLRALGSSES